MKNYRISTFLVYLILFFSGCGLNQPASPGIISWENNYPAFTSGAVSIDISLKLSNSANIYYLVSDSTLALVDGVTIRNEATTNEGAYAAAGSIEDIANTIIYITGLNENQIYYIYIAVEDNDSEILETLTIEHSCQMQQRLTPISINLPTIPLGYYQYLPESYFKNPEEKLPVILFLHGVYHRGNGQADEDLPKLLTVQSEFSGGLAQNLLTTDYPAVIIAPQCPEGGYWDFDNYESVDNMVDYILANYNIDNTRFYLTGLSMGGGAVWVYALDHADKISAIVPICSYINVNQSNYLGVYADRIDNLADMPIWAFHNRTDSQINVGLTESWVDAITLVQQSGDPTPLLTIYETGEGPNNHDAWTRAYTDEDMFEWLFLQQKTFRIGR